ncbi:hypothetical protein bcere0022_23500 [Bacillus cereus Rock3-44]|nr:hypothetical protein bcere0022_23500 [Bacillus cereus Rock3-44]
MYTPPFYSICLYEEIYAEIVPFTGFFRKVSQYELLIVIFKILKK